MIKGWVYGGLLALSSCGSEEGIPVADRSWRESCSVQSCFLASDLAFLEEEKFTLGNREYQVRLRGLLEDDQAIFHVRTREQGQVVAERDLHVRKGECSLLYGNDVLLLLDAHLTTETNIPNTAEYCLGN